VELDDYTLAVSGQHKEGERYVSSVRILSVDGKVLRRYSSISSLPQSLMLNFPRSVSVDNNGFVFVADSCNDRILVLNPELTDARPLPLTLDPIMKWPSSVWFEKVRGRLFVGEHDGPCRLLVFDNVYNVDTLFK
jgi:hypothetical protein